MNWLSNVVRPKIRGFLRRDVPENLWIKCPDTGQMVFYKDLEANQFVIPGSEYHMRMGAQQRLQHLFDAGQYEKVAVASVALDPLKFRDGRRYTDRLKTAKTQVRRLEEAGIDVAGAQGAERMEIRHWDQVYLQDGRFDCQRQLALIEGVLVKGKAKGFPRTRIMGGAEWAMMDLPGVRGFMEYEARLNDLLADHEDPVCCIYDVSKFSASLILDALRVHPAVIIGGVLQENPFYVPPDQFLRERGANGATVPC